MRGLQSVHQKIKALGGKIYFVGAETAENAAQMADKNPTNIPVLLDSDGAVAQAYAVIFDFPEYLQSLYKNLADPFAMDLAVDNPALGWKAALPATFVVDQDGIIRDRFINADFTKRMEPTDVLGAIRQLQEEGLVRKYGPLSKEVANFRSVM